MSTLRHSARDAFSDSDFVQSCAKYAELLGLNATCFENRDFRQFAVALIECSRLKEALAVLDQWEELNRESAILYSMKAHIFSVEGQIKQSIEAYRRSLELKSRASGYSLLGEQLAKLGDLKEAAKSFEKAIELDPTYAEAYHNLSVTLREKNPELAVQMFRTAESLGFEVCETDNGGNSADTFKDI